MVLQTFFNVLKYTNFIIFHRWILIFFQQVFHHLTHTRTGSFFFLQVYYARITEFLRFQPSPLQRSIDTGCVIGKYSKHNGRLW